MSVITLRYVQRNFAQRKLETIRLLSELFNRIKVSELFMLHYLRFTLSVISLSGNKRCLSELFNRIKVMHM